MWHIGLAGDSCSLCCLWQSGGEVQTDLEATGMAAEGGGGELVRKRVWVQV